MGCFFFHNLSPAIVKICKKKHQTPDGFVQPGAGMARLWAPSCVGDGAVAAFNLQRRIFNSETLSVRETLAYTLSV